MACRKRHTGVTEIAEFGTFTWKDLIALADTFLGTFWTDTTLEERVAILGRYEWESLDAPRLEMQVYDCRHDSLRFLAWLIEGCRTGPVRASAETCLGAV